MTPSATAAESSDSMAPSMAMIMAGWARRVMLSQVIRGTSGCGRADEMVKRSPMVSMPSMPRDFRPRAARVMRIMATREPGMRRLTLGVNTMIRMLHTPTSRAHQLMVPMFWP